MTLRRHYIDDGQGGQIHLTEAGSGPCVLLIHQTPRSADEFKEVMDLSSGRLRLVALDLPGMGRSTPVQGRPTIEAYADAASRVADWMNASSISLCGHHTGGVVAMELASRRPNWLSSLILSSTPWIDAPERIARRGSASIDTASHVSDGAHLLDYWNQRAPYYPSTPEYLDRFMADLLRANAASEGHRAVTDYPMEQRVGQLKCPVLVVEHGLDPFAARHIQPLLNGLTDPVLRSIKKGRVALEVTAPEFAEILQDWIRAQHGHVPTGHHESESSHEPHP